MKPTINAKMNTIMKTTMMNRISFTIHTLVISPIASPIDKAFPRFSVLANLH